MRHPRKRPVPPGFHVQADYAVIGVFALELIQAGIVALVIVAVGAIVLAVGFGGEA